MTTEAKTTALDREAVEVQLKAWMARGMPDGEIAIADRRAIEVDPAAERVAYIKIDTCAGVVMWALAFGERLLALDSSAMTTTRMHHRDLPGWGVEVYCSAPITPLDLRELGGGR